MKIKKYVAADMSLLLNQVKEELGDEAVIISTSVLNDGKTELIAALDTNDVDLNTESSRLSEKAPLYNDNFLRERLAFHHLVPQAEAIILSTCRSLSDGMKNSCDTDILAGAFNSIFHYGNLFDTPRTVKMFIGTHGSGKTSSLVKVAALAKIHNVTTTILNMDTVRAGADGQLRSFASILEAEYELVRTPENLFDKILAAQSDSRMVLIDTPGINPFSGTDFARLSSLCSVVSCDKVMVFDAGLNAEDAIETSDVFAKLGAEWLLPSKMDISRRIGAVLSLAALSGMQLGFAGVGRNIAGGLAAVDSKALAALIMG